MRIKLQILRSPSWLLVESDLHTLKEVFFKNYDCLL